MTVALAGRRCGGEGLAGESRRESDQMWAYGRTSVQEKQRCLQTKRGEDECVRVKVRGEGKERWRDPFLSQ